MPLPTVLILAYGFGLSGYWSLGKLVAVAWCGLWLALSSSYRRRGDVFLLAYLAVIAVTTATSADVHTSLFGLHGTYTLGLLPALALIPYWACVGPKDRPAIENSLRWGAAIFSVSVLAHRFVFNNALPTGNRAFGTMGSPIYAGALACLCLPFVRSWIERGVLFAALWATGSRGAWLGAAAGAVYFYWPHMSKRQRFYSVAVSVAGFFASYAIRPLSDLGRIIVWDAATDAFKSRPGLGWGAGNFYTIAQVWRNPLWDDVYGSTTQDHAHNLFLEAAATSGIVGLAALCISQYAIWRAVDRQLRAAFIGVGIVGMLNPLPLVVKALCLMLAASRTDGKTCNNKTEFCFVKGFAALVCGISAMLIYWDRMLSQYGHLPWSFSSRWAEYYLGIVREIVTRQMFKL